MSTSNDAEKDPRALAPELVDEDLAEANGGVTHHDKSADKYYMWIGYDNDDKYLCPNCRRPVHIGSWLRYYCDPCNASWLDESRLVPSIASGTWKEIPREEYSEDGWSSTFA